MSYLQSIDLTPYQQTLNRRQQEWEKWQADRQQQGWQVARQGALLLKTQYKSQKVWLFGSMLETRRVRRVSDIDLAVEGLADRFYLEALGALLDISDFSVDLVQVQYAKSRLLQIIYDRGVLL